VSTLFIIRGYPGSGKSWLAKRLSPVVFEEDDYWTYEDGTYHFDPATRAQAFDLMERNAKEAIEMGYSRIALATAALSFTDGHIMRVAKHAQQSGYEIRPVFLPLVKGRTSIHCVTDEDYAMFRREMQIEAEVDFR
jgi:hypothetical protein